MQTYSFERLTQPTEQRIVLGGAVGSISGFVVARLT
jgi:hypothetical protein